MQRPRGQRANAFWRPSPIALSWSCLAIFRHRLPVGYAHIWDRSVFTSIGFAEGIGERQKRNCVKSRNFSKGSNGVYGRVLRVSIKATLSALGQKRTFALHKIMSALPPKADMCSATRDVRFGPKADMAHLFNHLVGSIQ